MKFRWPITSVVASIALVGLGSPVSAQTIVENVISIPVDSILEAPEGSITLIGSGDVPTEFQGVECVVDVEIINQGSVHENNDLIIQSGGSSVEVLDVESEAFSDVEFFAELTLGATVDVSLRMGPDEFSSGGLLVTIDCPQAAAPTTTEAPTPTTPATPATTAPGGVGGETAGNSPAGQLPATGPETTVWFALIAAILVAGGGGLARVARRPRRT